MSKLCQDIYTNNVLYQKHEEIIKKLSFVKDMEEELMINYHNISRENLINFQENTLQYWIYLMVRDFEKKVRKKQIKIVEKWLFFFLEIL